MINTLKQSVKNVIGVPHDKSFPAMRMMEGQNFKDNGLIDVLDGGPSLECKVKDLKIFKSNKKLIQLITKKILIQLMLH